jgi:hypothetical protein
MSVEALKPELVREFVAVAHGDLARVQALLAAEPALVNACWDWGSGDWETGLGAAAHTGQTAIAELLLAHGARMDIFCAAMLGKIDLVRAFLADNPASVHLKGPHGIPLLAHAAVSQQAEVVALLQAAGA